MSCYYLVSCLRYLDPTSINWLHFEDGKYKFIPRDYFGSVEFGGKDFYPQYPTDNYEPDPIWKLANVLEAALKHGPVEVGSDGTHLVFACQTKYEEEDSKYRILFRSVQKDEFEVWFPDIEGQPNNWDIEYDSDELYRLEILSTNQLIGLCSGESQQFSHFRFNKKLIQYEAGQYYFNKEITLRLIQLFNATDSLILMTPTEPKWYEFSVRQPFQGQPEIYMTPVDSEKVEILVEPDLWPQLRSPDQLPVNSDKLINMTWEEFISLL